MRLWYIYQCELSGEIYNDIAGMQPCAYVCPCFIFRTMSNFHKNLCAHYALLATQMLHFKFPQSTIRTQQAHVKL